ITAVGSGEVQAMIVSVTTARGLAQAGKVRAAALSAAKRTPLLPDVPTAAEAGFGDIDLSAWIGLVAPAGTPVAIVERLNRDRADPARPHRCRLGRSAGTRGDRRIGRVVRGDDRERSQPVDRRREEARRRGALNPRPPARVPVRSRSAARCRRAFP
ncbi:MAG: hypothetical protein IPF73_04670, partial [Betaproteobacteria bacterium]|nr:hypothetical protein [Betaproteobacteria bacterium]